MKLSERHNEIERILSEKDYVTVEEFAKALDVSKVTIRSDLSLLEEKGVVIRTHGGAMLTELKSARRYVNKTMTEAEAQKTAIGQTAASMVEDGEMVIIDVGTTTVHVAEALKGRKVSVVTNSLLAMEALQDDPNVDLFALGGQFRNNSKGFIGNTTINAMQRINADILFLGCTSYDDNMIYSSNIVEAETKEAMMKTTGKIVLLADSEKYGRRSYTNLTDWSNIDVFITDKIEESLKAKLDNAGVEVIIVE